MPWQYQYYPGITKLIFGTWFKGHRGPYQQGFLLIFHFHPLLGSVYWTPSSRLIVVPRWPLARRARLRWREHMLTIMELDQDSYWKRGQEYLWWQAFQHCSCSSPLDDLVFVVCEVYLQDCGRRVLNGLWHLQCRRQANLHADMEKRE